MVHCIVGKMCPQMVGHLLTWWGLGPTRPTRRYATGAQSSSTALLQLAGCCCRQRSRKKMWATSARYQATVSGRLRSLSWLECSVVTSLHSSQLSERNRPLTVAWYLADVAHIFFLDRCRQQQPASCKRAVLELWALALA